MRACNLKNWALSIITLLILLMVGVASARAQEPSAAQTVCVLDFNRLGDDASLDWLRQGLAVMMISTMNRISPYQVIERAHLREILQEHGLVASGLVDMDTAIRQARLAKAQLLLLGSFARQRDRVVIQARLIRVSDQRILAQATWRNRHANVLSAPQALSKKLLASLGEPVDPAQLEGIEKEIPTTIDVAKAYYTGIQAFDDGRYPEALAHYLDAARKAGDFVKVYPAVLEMYYLLGESDHTVIFAADLAQSFEEKGDVLSAVEYYFAAAEQCLDPLKNDALAAVLLGKLLRLVEQHERKTGEIARTKQFILDRIDELHGTGKYPSFEKILADRSIRYRMWPGDIERELRRRTEKQARGGYAVFQDGKWIKRPVPRPSVLMWKIRAMHMLARTYARLGRIGRALDRYQELLDEYEFISQHPLYEGGHRDPIKTEAHFMVLYHYAKTGKLIRDHALNEINRLNVVKDRLVFRRDFTIPSLDRRARVASRYEDRGYEYFDFAAPPGHQIDSVTLRAKVEGIAAFGFNLPHPAGWPPQFSLSKRLKHFKFSKRGTYERTVPVPRGTEFFSIGTSWGPGLFSNTPAEVLYHQRFGPKDGRDIVWWQVSFVVSPKEGAFAKRESADAAPLSAPIQKLVKRYATGWDRAFVVREPQTVAYGGHPSLDVYAEDWLVYSMDGDVQVFHRGDPQLKIDIPITINTREREFDPSLVRTHDGRYALLWARGTSKRNARRFVAFSKDLLRWGMPQRLVFADPVGSVRYTYGQAEPPERTYNVAPVRRGYAMLLAQGFVRYSDDLRNWGPPQKVIPHDLYRNRLVKTRDGTVWAVYENSSDERQPYRPDDWLHGYFVVDGKRYRHVTELHVSHSLDGIHWQAAGKIVFPGQPSGLWAFPVSERQIGIAVAFNNLFMKWLTTSRHGDLRLIDSQLQIMHHSEEAEFFVRDSSIICVRPVFDFEKQKPLLLGMISRTLYERFAE
ncbi:MAG: FlgO family outer membrane protein [Candidatus Methylomirabilales bacterium]